MKITVIGSGIIGLTSAIALSKKGHDVSILTKELSRNTLSHKVGAIWFPFEIHPQEKAIHWGAKAYSYYQSDIIRGNGLSFIPFTVVTTQKSNTEWVNHMPKGSVREANPSELPIGADSAYIATVPLAEPPLYLPYLEKECKKLGISITQGTIQSLEEMATLNELIINCTGLGAKPLCQDELLKPMRGQILRSKPIPNSTSAVNSTQSGGLSYLICRSSDAIIGGTDYIDDWNLDVDPKDTEFILSRITESGIAKAKPEIIEELVGLRPRRTKVRFEYDQVYQNIFHNYGHGGAGFTVGWGCALELSNLMSGI